MASILEEYPLDFSRPELQALRDLLARTMFAQRQIHDVVVDSGLDPGRVDFTGSAVLQWHSILSRSRAEKRTDDLFRAITCQEPALEPRISELIRDDPVVEPKATQSDPLANPHSVGWKGFGDERIIFSGVDTLLGVAFLATGVNRSRSICRVTSKFSRQTVHGTASLVGPDLLLTNHHVLYDEAGTGSPAVEVEAWFDYESEPAGNTRAFSIVACDPATIVGDPVQDWAIVRLSKPPPTSSSVLDLTGASPPTPGDLVFIIQHPDGGPKMIGLAHNLVRHVDGDVIQYWADTKAGSSGAPVFNSRWQVVGLHHRWVTAPDVDGVAYRNQGRRIERVLDGLSAHIR